MTQSYEGARLAFRQSRYRDAFAQLKGLEADPECAILALRSLQRMRRIGEGLQFVAKFGASILQTATNADRAIFAAIAGRVCELGDNPDGASYWYTNARGYALLCEGAEVAAEVAYFSALSAWSRRDFAEAFSQVSITEQAMSPRLRAMGNDVRALIAMSEARFSEALSLYQTNLLLLGTSDESADHWLEANTLRQISGLAADFGRFGLAELIADRYEAFSWSADQSIMQFGCAFNTGLALDAMGYQVRAFKFFRDAAALASDTPFQMWVYAARSRAAQMIGERLFAEDQLSTAMKFDRECNWSAVNADARAALLDLALALCNTSASEAEHIILHATSVSIVRLPNG
jgi:tetratricopeptide (TPR) repeat protein